MQEVYTMPLTLYTFCRRRPRGEVPDRTRQFLAEHDHRLGDVVLHLLAGRGVRHRLASLDEAGLERLDKVANRGERAVVVLSAFVDPRGHGSTASDRAVHCAQAGHGTRIHLSRTTLLAAASRPLRTLRAAGAAAEARVRASSLDVGSTGFTGHH
jgi:hypothetical protein